MPPPRYSPLPYTTLFRSARFEQIGGRPATHGLIAGKLLAMAGNGIIRDLPGEKGQRRLQHRDVDQLPLAGLVALEQRAGNTKGDRKSTRLNSSHRCTSYAAAAVLAPSLHDALPICPL